MKDGKTVGLSTYTGYTYNERAMISLAMVDVEHSEPGDRGHAGLGRRRRRVVEADRRAPRASRDPGDGCPCAHRRGGACRISAQVVGRG